MVFVIVGGLGEEEEHKNGKNGLRHAKKGGNFCVQFPSSGWKIFHIVETNWIHYQITIVL